MSKPSKVTTFSVESLHDSFLEIIRSNEQFPVDFDQVWRWLGYSRKGYCKDVLIRNFIEQADYMFFQLLPKKQTQGRPSDEIHLTTDCFKQLSMIANTEKGKKVRRYYIQLEKMFWGELRERIQELEAENERLTKENADFSTEYEKVYAAKTDLQKANHYLTEQCMAKGSPVALSMLRNEIRELSAHIQKLESMPPEPEGKLTSDDPRIQRLITERDFYKAEALYSQRIHQYIQARKPAKITFLGHVREGFTVEFPTYEWASGEFNRLASVFSDRFSGLHCRQSLPSDTRLTHKRVTIHTTREGVGDRVFQMELR